MWYRRDESRYGNGRIRAASTKVKMAIVAAIPKVRVTSAVTVTRGVRRRLRTEYRKSWAKVPIINSAFGRIIALCSQTLFWTERKRRIVKQISSLPSDGDWKWRISPDKPVFLETAREPRSAGHARGNLILGKTESREQNLICMEILLALLLALVFGVDDWRTPS